MRPTGNAQNRRESPHTNMRWLDSGQKDAVSAMISLAFYEIHMGSAL
jgi:hypothetical protein